MTEDMSWLSFIPLGVMLLCIILCAVISLLRGFKKTLGSTVVIFVSAIVAFIITMTVCRPNSALISNVFDTVMSAINSESINSVFAIESVANATVYYSVMLVSPFVFTLVFFIFRLILGIVMRIVIKLIPLFNNCSVLLKRLGGAGLGVVNGFIIALVIMMPLLGTLNVVNTVTDKLGNSQTSSEETNEIDGAMSDVSKITEPLVDKGAGKLMLTLGGRALYNTTASVRYDGEKVTLESELTNLVGMVESVSLLAKDVNTYDEKQIEALKATADGLENSTLLRSVAAGLLSDVANKWQNGETFMGMEKINAGELLDSVVNEMLVIFSTSDKDNIASDFRTISDVFAVLIRKDIFKSAEDYEALLAKLGSEGAISDLISVIGHNERMEPLVDCISELSIRALASALGIPDDMDENYNALMNNIAGVLNTTSGMTDEERREVVKVGIGNALTDYGISVDGEAADEITNSVLSDLGDKGTLDGDDVKEFFAVYAVASAGGEPVSGKTEKRGYSVSKLSLVSNTDNLSDINNNEPYPKNKLVIGDDGRLWINGKALENYTVDNYMDSQAYQKGVTGVSFGDAVKLMSAETMISDIVTIDDLSNLIKRFSECMNSDEEAEKIEKIFVDLVEVLNHAGAQDLDTSTLVDILGPVLDDMRQTEVFGEELTGELLTAIMQSEKIVSSLGIRRSEATKLADKMNASADEGDGYAPVTKSISRTIDVVNATGNADATKEEKLETIKALMEDITPSSAEVMKELTTPSLIESFGVDKSNSEKSANAFNSVFTNMAQFKADNPNATQEEIDRESEAVHHVFVIAMDNSSDSGSEKRMFNSEVGNDGKLEMNAYDTVCLFADSVVMGNTSEELVYKDGSDKVTLDPIGSDGKLSQSDSDDLISALDRYYSEHSGTDGIGRQLNAIAAIFNVETNYN